MITIKALAISTQRLVSNLRKQLVVHRKNDYLVVTANFDASAAGEPRIRKLVPNPPLNVIP